MIFLSTNRFPVNAMLARVCQQEN